jgi:hypothetical protein
MSDHEWDDVEYVIRWFETYLGRKFSIEERNEFEQWHRREIASDHAIWREAMRVEQNTMLRASATLAFMKQLKARQGTFTPDFESLYKRKANFDRKLLGGESPHDRP